MSVEQTVADNYRRAPQKGQYVKAAAARERPGQTTILVVAAGLKGGVSALPATLMAAAERSNVPSRVMVLIKYSAIFETACLYVNTVAAALLLLGRWHFKRLL